MVPSNVYNLYWEKYLVRVLFFVLLTPHAGTGIHQARSKMSEVRIDRHSAVEERRLLRGHSEDVRTLAVPLPQLPPALLPHRRSSA
jgi:hypothetical protein